MIQQHTSSDLSVEALGEALDVSVSGYYAWRECGPSLLRQADEQLGQAITRVFQASRQTYGSHRVYEALRQDGVRNSRKRVARLMRECGLRSVRAVKRRVRLTRAGQAAFIVPNRLKQDFSAVHPNEKWVTDTTYIPTREGWLYLVSVMDLCSRQVVGWAMGTHHDALLASSALDMAVRRQRPGPGLIVHSNRGSEFANAHFHQRATKAKIQLSMCCPSRAVRLH